MSALKKCFGPGPAQGHFLKERLLWRHIPLRICPYKGIFPKDLVCQAASGRRQPLDLISGLGPEHFSVRTYDSLTNANEPLLLANYR